MLLNRDLISITDESEPFDGGDKVFKLRIDGNPMATVIKSGSKSVRFNWHVYGPQCWPEAQLLICGLLELSVIADKLNGGK